MLVTRAAIMLMGMAFWLPPASAQTGSQISGPNQAIDQTKPARTGPAPNLEPLSAFFGHTVSSIQFSGVSQADSDPLRDLLPQRIGAPLTRKHLHDAIQALYSTGKFLDIAVDAESSPGGGVALTFRSTANYFIGSITVVGDPKPPNANQLINAARMQLGEMFLKENLERGIQRMQRLMHSNGYFRASITPTLAFHDDTQQVDINFRVERGSHARVGQVIVEGDSGYSPEEIRHIAKVHPGDKVTTARVTRALTRLRKRYQKKNRLEAQVAIRDRTYHPETDRVDYTLLAQQGTKIDIHVEGAKLRKSQIKKYVPVYEENAVDDDLLNEGRRNFRDYFQTKGYFEVDMDVVQEVKPGEDHRSITYKVNLGDRHKLVSLVIKGNKYFDVETLRERMQVQPASLLLYYGRFSQTILTRDLEAIEQLYKANGFEQVKVSQKVIDDLNGEKGKMGVEVIIDEGAQTRVSSLKFEGNSSFTEERLRDLVSTVEGQPFSDVNVAADRDSIVSFYFNRGFPDVSLEAFAEPLPGKPTEMNVRYQIKEGEQIFVDRVLVSGLHFTRPYIVDRELRIHDGDPLSQSDMLESQRNLYDLGIFNQVNLAVQNPTGALTRKNVLLQAEEAKRYTFNYGLGIEVQTGDPLSCKNPSKAPQNVLACQAQGRTGVSPRVSFDVTRLNFLGRDHTVLLKTRLGRLQQRGLVSYEAPRFMNRRNFTLTFTTFFDKTRDVRTFTAERLEGSAQLQQEVNKGTQLLYRLVYRRVQVDPKSLQVDINLVPLLSKPVRVAIPSITYVRDTRDDPTDSHRGIFTSADFGVASAAIGGESNFTRFLVQNSSYHTFHKKRWVFARNTRIGYEEPFGILRQAFVPLPERFFAGGGNSHRGFAINQAGPRDLQTGYPIGGNALFINNLEVRTPPIALPIVEENLSAVFFHDAGNVFSSGGDILPSLIRFSQKNAADCRALQLTADNKCSFNYVSHAVGAGLRYRTPIGPVRVDFGYNLNPPAFAVRVPAVQAHPELGKRFNFFFSIGQTF